PLGLIVSGRAVLTAQDGMVFVFEDQGPHVLPGGRREKSEHVLETLAREISEEVGCAIVGEPQPLGFFELRNDGPRPEGHPYPYPSKYQGVLKETAGAGNGGTVDTTVPGERCL